MSPEQRLNPPPAPHAGQAEVDSLERSPTRARKIWRRTLFGAGLSLVTAGLLALAARPDLALLVPLFGLLLSLGALREVESMGEAGQSLSPALVILCLPLVLVLAWQLGDPFWSGGGLSEWERLAPLSTRLSVMAGVGFLAGLLVSRRSARMGGPELHPLGPMILFLWIVFPLLGLGWIRFNYGISGLIAVIVLSKLGDVAGYYVGSAIGKTHPFPRLSPGKTVAGCVGSFVVAALAGVACQYAGLFPEPRFGLASGLLLGALLNLSSQAGDLLESHLKRRGKVKDSGTLFGPSGGVLDVVDSLLLSVPAAIVGFPLSFVL